MRNRKYPLTASLSAAALCLLSIVKESRANTCDPWYWQADPGSCQGTQSRWARLCQSDSGLGVWQSICSDAAPDSFSTCDEYLPLGVCEAECDAWTWQADADYCGATPRWTRTCDAAGADLDQQACSEAAPGVTIPPSQSCDPWYWQPDPDFCGPALDRWQRLCQTEEGLDVWQQSCSAQSPGSCPNSQDMLPGGGCEGTCDPWYWQPDPSYCGATHRWQRVCYNGGTSNWEQTCSETLP